VAMMPRADRFIAREAAAGWPAGSGDISRPRHPSRGMWLDTLARRLQLARSPAARQSSGALVHAELAVGVVGGVRVAGGVEFGGLGR